MKSRLRASLLLLLLTLLFCATRSGAQIFQRPPCPQFISVGVLGYDGFIDKDGIYFPVTSLYHLTPGQSDVFYLTIPERPQTRTKAWEMAGVGATCYWWSSPLGLWKIVEETNKYGYVRDLVACETQPGTSIVAVTYDPYSGVYNPSGTDGDCDGTTQSGGSIVCHQEWTVIEVSYDGGITWEPWWSGYATICE